MTEPRSALRGALLLACALACAPAGAQGVSPSAAAASAAERAQKETDRTMYWIRVLATKPAPAKAAPRPVAAALPTARPAADAHDKPKAVAAATGTPANSANTADAASAAPAQVALAQAPTLSQPPIASTSDISALSSSHADDVASGVGDGAAAQPDVAPAPAEPDPGLTQVRMVQPDFPVGVVKRVHKGNVEVRFDVDPEGMVVEAVVVQSSNAHLNNAAIEAVRQWRFKPTPMTHTAAVNLVFDIDKE